MAERTLMGPGGASAAARRAVACGVVYLLVLLPFAMAQLGNDLVLIRPADGIGPALALVFGMPAIAGCAVAWLACSLVMGTAPAAALLSAAAQLVYLLIPFAVWHGLLALGCKVLPGAAALDPSPRIDSSLKVATFTLAAVVDSLFSAVAFDELLMRAAGEALTPELGFYHAFVFMLYLGLPCVLVLGRRRDASRGDARGRMALGELVVALFLGVTAALVCVFFVIAYGVYFLDGTFSTLEDALALLRTFYVTASQITPAGLVVMMLALGALSRRATRPVEALTASTSAFVGMLEARRDTGEKLEARPVDEAGMAPAAEVRQLVDAVNAMERDLVAYVEELETVTAERERTQAELDIARDIQASAIPHDFSAQRAHGLAIEGFMRPAREVGGDFYDVFDIDADRTALVVGDVSGKGAPAALFMMRAQGLIRNCVTSAASLGEALSAANDGLCERNDAMLFVTAFVCVLDRATGTLSYANAGHNPPSVVRAGVRSYLDVRPGLVLGAMEGIAYASFEMPFAPGDEVLLYTDGVTEAANAAAELFGEARLAGALAELDERAGGVAGPAPIADEVVARIDAFAGEAPQADDITLLRLVWEAPGGSIDLASEDAELPRLLDFIDAEVARAIDDAEGAEAARKLAFELKLVAEELFVNTSHYGHPDAPAVPVRVTLRFDMAARRLHLVHADAGVAYDPLGHKTVMPTLEGPVGGLGIHLMRRIMDRAAYARAGERNLLYMVKGF